MRKRRAADYSTFAYTRRYLGRMVIALTLLTPLLVVMTYQWTPRRGHRVPDDLVTVALASSPQRPTQVQVGFNSARANRAAEPPSDAGGATASGLLSPRVDTAFVPRTEPLAGGLRPAEWYRAAAAEHQQSPYLLEALHHVESSAASDGCWPNAEGSGAVGPFQFKRPTFAEHGIDGNGDGVVDICGFVDSLMSAAIYLRALGADENLDGLAVRQALEQYGTDVDRVLDLARYYRARDGSLTAGTPPES